MPITPEKHDMFRVRNWDRWQSYRRDRNPPPWIKIHRRIMCNPEWMRLTDAQKGQLLSIWLVAADNNGHIIDCPRTLKKMCGLDDDPDLEVFVSLGFLEVASTCRQLDVNLTSTWRQYDAPDTDTDTDTEADYIPPRARERTDKLSELENATTAEFQELYDRQPSGPILTAERSYFNVVESGACDPQTLARRWPEFCRRQRAARLTLPYFANWLDKGGWADASLDIVTEEVEALF